MSIDRYPTPAGPHIVGVRDGELTDTRYPSNRVADAEGRRLMFRVWYPASAETSRRPYFLEQEGDAVIGGFADLLEQSAKAAAAAGGDVVEFSADIFDPLRQLVTHSHVDAPVADGRFPVVVFSHGATTFVQQNTPLMEHLASHGYVVFSLAHPGGSAAVLFADGTVVGLDPDFLGAVADRAYIEGLMGKVSPDITVRWDTTQKIVSGGIAIGVVRFLQRWIDDHKALVDALTAAEPIGVDEIVAVCDTSRIAWAGMSYGGAAAATGAQQDQRVRAAINLDGGQWLPDLLATAIRTPLLSIHSDLAKLGATMGAERMRNFNEFYYEPLETMGSRDDIVRVEFPRTTHLELTDIALLPAPDRRKLPQGGDCDAIDDVVKPLNDLCLGFLDRTLKGADNSWPNAQLAANPSLVPVDVRYVADWAATRGT